MEKKLEVWKRGYAFKNHAYGTDVVTHAMHPMSVDDALQRKFIRTNPNNLTSLMIVDVDEQDAERFILSRVWDDRSAPEPNFITTNLATSHAQAGYFLKSPVSTSALSSIKIVRYMKDMQSKLTHALGGDPQYRHHVARSPFAVGHSSLLVRDDPFELSELKEHLKDVVIPEAPFVPTMIGRNCEMFDEVRVRAYKIARTCVSEASLRDKVELEIQFLNEEYAPDYLGEAEIRSLAKSISSYAWKRMNPEAFSRRQKKVRAARTAKTQSGDFSGEPRSLQAQEEFFKILCLKQQKMKYADMSEVLNLSVQQITNKFAYGKRQGWLETFPQN